MSNCCLFEGGSDGLSPANRVHLLLNVILTGALDFFSPIGVFCGSGERAVEVEPVCRRDMFTDT